MGAADPGLSRRAGGGGLRSAGQRRRPKRFSSGAIHARRDRSPGIPLWAVVPAEQMPDVLAVVGDWPPMTWAVDVVAEVTTAAEFSTDGSLGIAGLGALVALALSVASLSMTRKTA